MNPNRGLRAIALFEAAKGIIVFAAGLGALRLLNGNAQYLAERIVRHLQLDPAGRYTRIILELTEQITNKQIWMVTGAAAAYCLVRFVEAYGLWKERAWAEWFAVIGGGLYIPWELHFLIHKPTPLKGLLLGLNVLVVVYVAWVLLKKRSKTNEVSTASR